MKLKKSSSDYVLDIELSASDIRALGKHAVSMSTKEYLRFLKKINKIGGVSPKRKGPRGEMFKLP